MTHLDKNLNFDCGVLNGAGTVSSLSSEWTKEISNTPNRSIFLPSNHQQVASKELQKSFQTYSLKITVMSPMFQKLFGTNHRTNMNQQIQDVSISKEKKVPRLFFQLQGNFKSFATVLFRYSLEVSQLAPQSLPSQKKRIVFQWSFLRAKCCGFTPQPVTVTTRMTFHFWTGNPNY